MRVRVRVGDLTSATEHPPGAATRFEADGAEYLRLSLLPGGTLIADILAHETGSGRVRVVATNPIELLQVETAGEVDEKYFHLPRLREAISALGGAEISLTVSRSPLGWDHLYVDLSDGEHRVMNICTRLSDKQAA